MHALAIVPLLLLASGVLGADDAARERVVARIRDLGGKVQTEDFPQVGPIVIITLARSKATDADVADLTVFPNLAALFLTETAITDAALKNLKSFPLLGYLNLAATRISNDGLRHLADVRDL